MNRKHVGWMGLVLATALAVSACGKASQTPKTGGEKILTIGMWSSPDTFSPVSNDTSYGSRVIELLYPSLMIQNDKLEFVPYLAETVDMNEKQDVFTFKIRQDAKWSDGKPITAEDVAYTYQVIAHPDTPTTRRELIDTFKGVDQNGISETKDLNVAGIKVVDEKTVQFTTKAPVEKDAFLEKVGVNIWIMPKAILSAATNLKEIDKADWALKPTVFGGPFKLVEYKTDSYVELAPNESFWGGKPKLDKLFLKIVNQTAFTAALEKGEIDATGGAGVGEVPIADWEKISALPDFTPVTFVAQQYQYLDFNTSKPEFADAKVRQAFAHAINRPLLVQRLLKGQGEVLNTPLNSANKYFVQGLQSKLEYDKEKAKQMLTEAGWDFNQEVVILTPTGNLVREQSADIIMANLKEIGVTAKIEKVDFPTRQSRSKNGQYQLSLVGFSSTFDPDFGPQIMTGAGFNDRKYSNKQMDDLLVKGKVAIKVDEKKQIYTQAQELFIQELPLLPLYSPKSLNVVNKRVVNWKIGPQGFTWNAAEWDVK